jgi:hypothetical protein
MGGLRIPTGTEMLRATLGTLAGATVLTNLTGCANEQNPLPQSRGGAGSYAPDSVRMPVDPATHVLRFEVSEQPRPTVVNFAGGVGASVGSESNEVPGAQHNQSRKYILPGVIRDYEVVGRGAGLGTKIAEPGRSIVIEGTDRKMTALLPGQLVVLKCLAQTEVLSSNKANETLNENTLRDRRILEFDFCEMASPKINATQSDFAKIVQQAKRLLPSASDFSSGGMFDTEEFPLPTSREGAYPYAAASARLPVDTSGHLVMLRIGIEPKNDTASKGWTDVNGTTVGAGGVVYGSVSTTSAGGDQPKNMLRGQVEAYEILGGVPQLRKPIASIGDQIVLEATDRKTEGLRPGNVVIMLCVPDLDVIASSKEKELLTPEKLAARHVRELDYCEMAEPGTDMTKEDFVRQRQRRQTAKE